MLSTSSQQKLDCLLALAPPQAMLISASSLCPTPLSDPKHFHTLTYLHLSSEAQLKDGLLWEVFPSFSDCRAPTTEALRSHHQCKRENPEHLSKAMGVRGEPRLPFFPDTRASSVLTVVPTFSPSPLLVSAPPSLLLVIYLFLVPDKESSTRWPEAPEPSSGRTQPPSQHRGPGGMVVA